MRLLRPYSQEASSAPMASPTLSRTINVPGAMRLKQPERIMACQEQAIQSVSITGTQLPSISEIE